MLELLRYGGELSEQSQGAFDMTVEPLMNLWGFGPQARVEGSQRRADRRGAP